MFASSPVSVRPATASSLALAVALLMAPSVGGASPKAAPPRASTATVALSLQEFEAATVELRGRLDDAAAIEVALGLTHSRWTSLGAPGVRRDACRDPAVGHLAALSSVLGAAHRDSSEGVRLHHLGLLQASESATVAPLLSLKDRTGLGELAIRTARTLRVQAAFSDWHERHIARAARSCTPALHPAPGFQDPAAQPEAQVAIVALPGGSVCPGAVPAQGGVVVIEGGAACWDDAACACAPIRVLPGAVLGP